MVMKIDLNKEQLEDKQFFADCFNRISAPNQIEIYKEMTCPGFKKYEKKTKEYWRRTFHSPVFTFKALMVFTLLRELDLNHLKERYEKNTGEEFNLMFFCRNCPLLTWYSWEREELSDKMKSLRYPVVRWEMVYDLLSENRTKTYHKLLKLTKEHMNILAEYEPEKLLILYLRGSLVDYILNKDELIREFMDSMSEEMLLKNVMKLPAMTWR